MHAVPMDSGGARGRIYQAALRLFAENGGNAVTISELADTAGIARGTVYNNITEPENLFGEVAASLSREMLARTEATMHDLADPTRRIATGLRLFVRRAHEQPDWGRFLARFALSNAALQDMMRGAPARDIEQAIEEGRFKTESSRAPALVTMLMGSTLAAMSAVTRGDQAWREAGTATAELFLRAGGVAPSEARRIAQAELPLLASAPRPPNRKNNRRKS